VNREAVARVVSSVASIPIDRLLMTDAERLLNMEKIIGLQLIGHSRAVRSIAGVIRRNYAGFANRRPIGSFLFLGPTGVGKTECARALASFLFGSRDALVKIDMSEYSEGHSVSRLVGSPPGYVGHQEGGQLTEAVRRKPYTIVLFDEVEKAHAEVQQVLLQILDDGRLTDGRGRSVDFSNVVVILTSNLGSADLSSAGQGQAKIGFGQAASSPSVPDASEKVMAAARKAFPAELWGRMEERLFFRPLNNADLIAIATLMLKESAAQIERERDMHLDLDPGVGSYLVEKGCPDPSLGARPLRGALRKLVEEPLAEAILSGRLRPGDHVRVGIKAGSLQMTGSGNST
jgi:ATP-dependent Clp protease ATP-binding subunit ClpC